MFRMPGVGYGVVFLPLDGFEIQLLGGELGELPWSPRQFHNTSIVAPKRWPLGGAAIYRRQL